VDHGFRAVISTSIADIFRGNALKNGLLPIAVGTEAHRAVLAAPGAEVTVDLARSIVRLPDGSEVAFAIDPFARHCLLHGVDELGFLLGEGEAIAAYERGRSLPAPETY
jgi:3-isopropylmalate/(R)-2-methylmalate dehydratase small subunit